MELISREKVLKAIEELEAYTWEEKPIKDRQKGKWIDKNLCEITCSNCNEDVPQEFYNCSYCPNCGAMMETETWQTSKGNIEVC